MKKAYDCPSGGKGDTALLYLAGTLSEADANAFEEHYFSCADCREDVGRGGELRAALGRPPVGAAAPAARPRRVWLPLAAAAAIAVVGVGLWRFSQPLQDAPSASRASEESIAGLKASARPGGGLDLTWTGPPAATSYEIQVFGRGGRRLWRTETREPVARIEPSALSSLESGETYEIRVEALDGLGQVIASGEISSAPRP